MENLDTAGALGNNIRLYFNTDVLNDEALKARVANEIKNLGALIEPDFAKQVAEGKGLTLRRVYCYELALNCDVTVKSHVHYEQLEKRKTGEWEVSETSSGKYKVEEVEKWRIVEHDYDDYKTLADHLVGMKCMIFPDSKFNSIIGQDNSELDWSKELLSGSLKNYSQQGSVEYLSAENYFKTLSNQKIMDTLTSQRAYTSSTPLHKFIYMNIDNYYPERSVARIRVVKYYVYVSYKGQNYNLELDSDGNLDLNKSLFPVTKRVYTKHLSNEELHKMFIDSLRAEGDKIDKGFLNFASDIKNVSFSAPVKISVIDRIRALSQKNGYTKYLGLHFSSATCNNISATNNFKINKEDETLSLFDGFKSNSFLTVDNSGKLSNVDVGTLTIPELSRGVNIKESSVKKDALNSPCFIIGADEYTVTIRYNEDVFTNTYSVTKSAWTDDLKYKLSDSFKNQTITELMNSYNGYKSYYKGWFLGILTTLFFAFSLFSVIAIHSSILPNEYMNKLSGLFSGNSNANVFFYIYLGTTAITFFYPLRGFYNLFRRIKAYSMIRKLEKNPTITKNELDTINNLLWYKSYHQPREDFLYSFIWALILTLIAVVVVVSPFLV